jgi:hypothetical protein
MPYMIYKPNSIVCTLTVRTYIVHTGKFIVNREPHYKSLGNYYQCPSCHTFYGVEPEDSFLKAMVSEEQMANFVLVEKTLKVNEALGPLKAFLNVPIVIKYSR